MKRKRKPVLIAAAVMGLAWLLWAAVNLGGESIVGSWTPRHRPPPIPISFGTGAPAGPPVPDYPERLVFRKDGTYRWDDSSAKTATGSWRRLPRQEPMVDPVMKAGGFAMVSGDVFVCEDGGIIAAEAHCSGNDLYLFYTGDHGQGTARFAGEDYARPGHTLFEFPGRLWNWIERTFRR